MDRRQFLASVAIAPLATLPEIGYTAPQTDADKVRELVGDLLPGCEFYDGPPSNRDAMGRRYKVFALGAHKEIENQDRRLRAFMRGSLAGAGEGAKICQVRAFYLEDGQAEGSRQIYARLTFWPDRLDALAGKLEGEPINYI